MRRILKIKILKKNKIRMLYLKNNIKIFNNKAKIMNKKIFNYKVMKI